MDDGGLFDGLPPPSAPPLVPEPAPVIPLRASITAEPTKSAIKVKTKRLASDSRNDGSRQVRFKSATEISKESAIEAIKKIAAHIGNPAKFAKASKLALQLLAAGSVTAETSEPFFGLLEAAMSPPSKANESAVRADYQALFCAVEDKLDCFSLAQREQLDIWLLWAQLANDFHTDDTFVFSKAAIRLKQAISSLPEADHRTEASASGNKDDHSSSITSNEVDPFGLNALFQDVRTDKNEEGRILRQRREALIECWTIATKRYKQQWAQTIIDITATHVSENMNRFEGDQRQRIEKLCLTVKDQQVKRKQGKSNTGKLDVTSFERYREMYANEKISIRKAVGASGDRSAEQWLG